MGNSSSVSTGRERDCGRAIAAMAKASCQMKALNTAALCLWVNPTHAHLNFLFIKYTSLDQMHLLPDSTKINPDSPLADWLLIPLVSNTLKSVEVLCLWGGRGEGYDSAESPDTPVSRFASFFLSDWRIQSCRH